MGVNLDLSFSHKTLDDAHATRRYFKKFERIIGHVENVAKGTVSDREALQSEVKILQRYLSALSNSFTALSYKYLFGRRVSHLLPSQLQIDRLNSGFPVYLELLQMANDALQADAHLSSMPTLRQLKMDMVNHILNEHKTPLQLQFAASQRLYYEQLTTKPIFWAHNDPRIQWMGDVDEARRAYRVHWANYDSEQNIPIVYILDVQDTGRTPLAKDQRRWPRVQSQLHAQSQSTLKLLTIAKGFDKDFDDLHPKRLRRIFVGPLYSFAFTEQSGPLRDVLAEAQGKPGLDWALAFTTQTLVSSRSKKESSGFFSQVEREIFQLDPFDGAGPQSNVDGGYSDQQRSLILPQRPYQILEERNPKGFEHIRKYVVSPKGKIHSYK